MMPAAVAAGPIASGTGIVAAGAAEQFVQCLLERGYYRKPLAKPSPFIDAQGGNFQLNSLKKCRPVGVTVLMSFGHDQIKKRHRASTQVPRSKVVGENRKPGSVPCGSYPPQGDDHSSRTAVADSLKQPDPGVSDGPSSSTPLFGLAPDGVYRAAAVTNGTGELLPHPFTLTTPLPKRRRAVFSLWHFPWGRPRSPLRTILPCGARTFLPLSRHKASAGGDHLVLSNHVGLTDRQSSSFTKSKRLQCGQDCISFRTNRLLNICGGRCMWQPRQAPPLASTTATPARRDIKSS
jgi:hypothetical protein